MHGALCWEGNLVGVCAQYTLCSPQSGIRRTQEAYQHLRCMGALAFHTVHAVGHHAGLCLVQEGQRLSLRSLLCQGQGLLMSQLGSQTACQHCLFLARRP